MTLMLARRYFESTCLLVPVVMMQRKLQTVGYPAKEENVFRRILSILLWLVTGASATVAAICFVIANARPNAVSPLGSGYGPIGVVGALASLLLLLVAVVVESGRK
jgi:hypothetical protein